MIDRFFKMQDVEEESVFFFGARQTGKTTLLKQLFHDARYYDLLKSEEFERLSRRPQLLREELQDFPERTLVIIDEIQKLPSLLDEVHWLMVNRDLRFVLTGSSARKLRRGGVNLLGGRALVNNFYPLVSAEIPDFNIDRAVNNGMLPRHYLVADATKRLGGYVGLYLQSEIVEEAVVRNLPSFNRFLEAAALTSGEVSGNGLPAVYLGESRAEALDSRQCYFFCTPDATTRRCPRQALRYAFIPGCKPGDYAVRAIHQFVDLPVRARFTAGRNRA